MSEQPTDGPEGDEDESKDEQPDAAGGEAEDGGAAGEPLPERVTAYTYDDTGRFVLPGLRVNRKTRVRHLCRGRQSSQTRFSPAHGFRWGGYDKPCNASPAA
ncbi:MAG: hypothetical protein HYU66_18615 [Armatimonadetes bacterium]|nr:hypothetical protein [Armatimonadota bacterium]